MPSRVTTKKGDSGATRTLSGDIVSKSDLVLDCTGYLDALRAQLARLRLMLLRENAIDYDEHAEFLFWLLHVLFLVGTEVNDPEAKHPEYRVDTVQPKHLERLEAEQARLEGRLELPKAFIVSAANPAAAESDLCATVCRTLERNVVRLREATPDFDARQILPFLNRLSDYLFVLARHLEQGNHIPVDYTVLDRT